jgi:predicted GTPase
MAFLKSINLIADDGYSFMGPTGSGKSHVRDISYVVFSISSGVKIIDTLTGQPGRRSGSRLEPCTSDVSAVRLLNHPVHDDRLVLVDTPGFDDTNKSDLDVLQIVSNWLQKV